MEKTFQLSCESTVDLPYSYVSGRDISVLFYTYLLDGVEYYDDMGRDPKALPAFYEALAAGKQPTTSQINTYRYEEYFDGLLQKGDVFHICLGTGMTPSYENAKEAAKRLESKYPDRKLVVLDSLGSSSGYGLLVDTVADLRDQGADMDELAEFVLQNRNKIHHQFFSTDMTQFRRSGRVSGLTATAATVLDICPLMHLNSEGKIIAYQNVRGKNRAIKETAKAVAEHYEGGNDYHRKIFMNQSNCMDLAEATRNAIAESLGDVAANVPIYDIGTIIASHCGPGTVVVYFFGDERKK